MIDASTETRAARLHRIAAVEIARHREAQGFLGAALEGSLATGNIWPSSDVDFTIIPRPEHSPEHLVAWEQREALPFVKERADQWVQIDVCGEREGIPWHKHLTDHRALRDLLEGYPESFIRPADGPFDPGANWLLDGLSVMAVIDDPEGLLGETHRFVAAHRFAADVWEGRRFALLRELRRQRDLAHEAMERGEVEAAYQRLSGDTGFAAVAAQLWLEGAQRITSGKEQDGRLAEVTRAAGCPEAHALYRRALAVEPERAEAAVPFLRRLGEQAVALYRSIGTSPPEAAERRREARVWGAYVGHLLGTLSLAPGLGHPALVYQSLRSIGYWATEYPARMIGELREKGASGVATLGQRAAGVAALAQQIRTILLDPLAAAPRAQACLAAADQLLELTEARR
jgi:predicted nucleotidyltransferase